MLYLTLVILSTVFLYRVYELLAYQKPATNDIVPIRNKIFEIANTNITITMQDDAGTGTTVTSTSATGTTSSTTTGTSTGSTTTY